MASDALSYCVNRFTNAGDSVLCINVETLADISSAALRHGRLLEVLATTDAGREAFKEQAFLVFNQAYKEGVFNGGGSSSSATVGRLPEGVLEDTTPAKIAEFVEGRMEDLRINRKLAAFKCAQRVTSGFGWGLCGEKPSEAGLMTQPGKLVEVGKNCIHMWGTVMICDSVEDAIRATIDEGGSADTDGVEYVRLIQIYDNAQLRKAIAKGETCNSKSAMYLQVAPSCPVYYLPCHDEREGRVEFEIIPSYDLKSTNEAMKMVLGEQGPGQMRCCMFARPIARISGKAQRPREVWCALAHPVIPCTLPTKARSNSSTEVDGRREGHSSGAVSKRKRGDDGSEEGDENDEDQDNPEDDTSHGEEEQDEECGGDGRGEAIGNGEGPEIQPRDSQMPRISNGKRARRNPIQPGEKSEPSDDSDANEQQQGEESDGASSFSEQNSSGDVKEREESEEYSPVEEEEDSDE